MQKYFNVDIQDKFVRKCKLEFYNKNNELLYEYYGGSGRYLSGEFEPKIVFDVVKTNDPALQTSMIKMYNLNKEGSFFNALLQENLLVKIYAGYEKDFLYGVNNMIPIYSGVIFQRPKTIYTGPISETTLYCYSSVTIKTAKVPAFSIKGKTTTKILFAHLRDKIANLGINLTIPNDADLQSQLGDIYNKTISQLGYSAPNSKTLDEFLTLIAKVLSDDNNSIQWYIDDNKKQIVFYNSNVKGLENNTITLTSGINILEFDPNSVLQTERSNYLANLTGQQQKKHKKSKTSKLNKNIYRVSTFLQPNIYLDTKIALKNIDFVEVPDSLAIHKIRYYGDTHGNGNDWRVDLDLYERK